MQIKALSMCSQLRARGLSKIKCYVYVCYSENMYVDDFFVKKKTRLNMMA